MMSNRAVCEAEHGALAVFLGCTLCSIATQPHGQTAVILPPVEEGLKAFDTALKVCLAHKNPSWQDVASLQPYLDHHARQYGAQSLARHEQLAAVQTWHLLSDPDISAAVTALAERLDRTHYLRGAEATAIVQPFLRAYHQKRAAATQQTQRIKLREEIATLDILERQMRRALSLPSLWVAEPGWLARAMTALQEHNSPPLQAAGPGERAGYAVIPGRTKTSGSLAVINMSGVLEKTPTMLGALFGATSTWDLRRQLRQAVADESVSRVLISGSTPGGSVDGIQEVAHDVARLGKLKEIHVAGSDVLASAGYWIASGAKSISLNETGETGSIGSVLVAEDSSERAARLGVRVIPVRTGKFKAAGLPGTALDEETLGYLQSRVDNVQTFFADSVARGRGVSAATVQSWADGRVWGAREAKAKGVIDHVRSLDETIDVLRG